MINVGKLVTTSSIAGLQTLGTVTGQGEFSGVIPAAGFLTLADPIIITLPYNDVLTMTRIQITGNGTPESIANYWYPLEGSICVYDETPGHGYFMVIYMTSSAAGRNIYVTLLNNTQGNTTVTGLTFNVFMHLYSYPF